MKKPIILWMHILTIIVLLILEEEEEEEEDEYYDDHHMSNIEKDLSKWWSNFKQKASYPLYGIILGTKVDQEVTYLIENHRKEISELSGPNCCFIYFRDLRNAKIFKPYSMTDHQEGVFSIVRVTGIRFSDLPCVLFFEDIDSGKYVLVKLKGKSTEDIIILFREIFDHIRKRNQTKILRALARSNRIIKIRLSTENLAKNIISMGREALSELMKSFIGKI